MLAAQKVAINFKFFLMTSCYHLLTVYLVRIIIEKHDFYFVTSTIRGYAIWASTYSSSMVHGCIECWLEEGLLIIILNDSPTALVLHIKRTNHINHCTYLFSLEPISWNCHKKNRDPGQIFDSYDWSES